MTPPPRASPPWRSTRSPRRSSGTPAAPRRSWDITGFPRPSAPPSTTGSCTASRRRPRYSPSGDLVSIDCGAIVNGWHGDSAITFGVGALIPVDETAVPRHPGIHGGRYRGDGARQPAHRRLPRDRTRHPGRRGALRTPVRHRRGLRRARHRPRDAPGPVPAQRGSARARVRCWRRVRAGDRADADPRHRRDRASSTTTGPSSPPTGRAPPIGSTPWRPPTTDRAFSLCPRPETPQTTRQGAEL